jgi:hypothetical protein
VTTSLGSESVVEDVFEDVVLVKHTMICVKVVLIPGIIEMYQLIFRYSSLSADFWPMKIIVSKGKYCWKLRDLQLKAVAFNCEVES